MYDTLILYGRANREKLRVEREPGGGFVIALYVGTSAEMNCPLSARDARALAEFLIQDPLPTVTEGLYAARTEPDF